MKQLLTALVVVLGIGMLVTGCSKARKVETDKLSQSFASASDEVKGNIQKALGAIKTRDFETALASLKKVVESGDLSEDQRQALTDTVTDITVIISENPPENADDLFDQVADINDVLLQ